MYVLELAGQDDAFARREAASAASDVAALAPGLATATDVDPARVARLAYTHRASELVGTGEPTLAAARTILENAAVDRTGSAAVRAVDVRGSTGVDTQAVERELGQLLADAGLAIDLEAPDHELRALFADAAGDPDGEGDAAACALGWEAVASVRDFGERAPTDRPFFQPGSMDPIEARALANLAGARPGATVLDPMCGTGGLLLEAALLGAEVLGGDVQATMVRGSRRNLAHGLGAGRPTDDRYPHPGDRSLYRGSATDLPLPADAVDAVAFDAPYGRQSKVAGDLATVVAGALAEARRVADRCVFVADRAWETTARDAGWTVAARFERRVHRSLVRHVHCLR